MGMRTAAAEWEEEMLFRGRCRAGKVFFWERYEV